MKFLLHEKSLKKNREMSVFYNFWFYIDESFRITAWKYDKFWEAENWQVKAFEYIQPVVSFPLGFVVYWCVKADQTKAFWLHVTSVKIAVTYQLLSLFLSRKMVKECVYIVCSSDVVKIQLKGLIYFEAYMNARVFN